MGSWYRSWMPWAVLAAAGLGAWFWYSSNHSAPQFRTALIERGAITAIISAVGKVNPVVTVQVGSQVSGTIQKLFADFNSRVQKGQVVAQIDPALFQAQVEQARAKVANDEANVEKARVQLADAERTLRRMTDLRNQNLISQSDQDTAQTARDSAVASLKSAQTQVDQDRASLRLAETNLRYTTIQSPVDGTVISRNVDVGQTVAASLQAPTLFTIAQDLGEMQVDTNIDEADIGRVSVGQEALFTVDAYPERPFRGRVHDIYNQPITVQNVVTYDAIIRVPNPDLLLKPGMTANVTVTVGHRDEVLKLPNGALRYRPERTGKEPAGGRPVDAGTARVWVLRDGAEVGVAVTLGLSDSISTEVVSGELKAGDGVILERVKRQDSTGASGSPPRMRF